MKHDDEGCFFHKIEGLWYCHSLVGGDNDELLKAIMIINYMKGTNMINNKSPSITQQIHQYHKAQIERNKQVKMSMHEQKYVVYLSQTADDHLKLLIIKMAATMAMWLVNATYILIFLMKNDILVRASQPSPENLFSIIYTGAIVIIYVYSVWMFYFYIRCIHDYRLNTNRIMVESSQFEKRNRMIQMFKIFLKNKKEVLNYIVQILVLLLTFNSLISGDWIDFMAGTLCFCLINLDNLMLLIAREYCDIEYQYLSNY